MRVTLETKIIKIDADISSSIKEAVELIKSSEVVVFPTETVYGIGANGLDREAVLKIFKIKNRPADNPLILHVFDKDWIYEYAVVKEKSMLNDLYDRFSPGPITFILDKKNIIPYETTGGLDSVAIRIPDHQIALSLIKDSKLPIAAPSANISGRPSATNIDMLKELFNKVPLIIDGGETQFGIESTVVDIRTYPLKVLRPGSVTIEELKKVVGRVEINNSFISPGTKYRHYKVSTTVCMFKNLNTAFDFVKNNNFIKPFFISRQKIDKFDGYNFNSYNELSSKIYRLLYECEAKGYDLIMIEEPESEGIGFSILNRLQKASDYFIN